MAYILSSGLWDALGTITLEQLLGQRDMELERDLKQWQEAYDDQFKCYPYDFDWDTFNEQGRSLTERIRAKLIPGNQIYYEPSDDREFFKFEECDATLLSSSMPREHCLRKRKFEVLSNSVAGSGSGL
jgi:hypothetical protein